MIKRILAIRDELMKFGSVGLVAYIVGVGGFNLLVHTERAPFASKPITGSVISGIVSIMVSYLGNRHWTWKNRSKRAAHREIALFFFINIIGLIFSSLTLAFSRYVLGFNSVLSDNISANVIGVGIGTLFRFWAYRTWVFPTEASSKTSEDE